MTLKIIAKRNLRHHFKMKLSHSVSRTEKFSTKLCVSIGDIRITYNELELYPGNPFKQNKVTAFLYLRLCSQNNKLP